MGTVVFTMTQVSDQINSQHPAGTVFSSSVTHTVRPAHPTPLRLYSAAKKADCTISMSDTDLLALMTGKMNAQTVSICFR